MKFTVLRRKSICWKVKHFKLPKMALQVVCVYCCTTQKILSFFFSFCHYNSNWSTIAKTILCVVQSRLFYRSAVLVIDDSSSSQHKKLKFNSAHHDANYSICSYLWKRMTIWSSKKNKIFLNIFNVFKKFILILKQFMFIYIKKYK